MKRFIVLVLLLILAIPGLQARKKRPKAGEVDGQTYKDANFGFSINLPEDWRYKINLEEDPFRMVLTQKNYEIPPDYIDAPDYTQVPRIVIYAAKTDMSPFVFLDSLTSDTYSSDQKSEMLKEFEIFHDFAEGRESLVPRSRKSFSADDHNGVLWSAQCKYVKEVSLSSSSTGGGGKRVRGAYGGTIVALSSGDSIIVFHMICEWIYHPTIEEFLLNMVSSIKFDEGK